MNQNKLKSVWVFHEGQFVGRRWVVDEQGSVESDSVSAPLVAAIEVCDKTQAVGESLSEELSRKRA